MCVVGTGGRRQRAEGSVLWPQLQLTYAPPPFFSSLREGTSVVLAGTSRATVDRTGQWPAKVCYESVANHLRVRPLARATVNAAWHERWTD